MKIPEIETPIAQRLLTAGDTTIVVTIGKPVPSEDDYSCPYAINIGERTKVGCVMGVDAVQVLQLVMIRIGGELAVASESLGREISWFEDTIGETGFPK